MHENSPLQDDHPWHCFDLVRVLLNLLRHRALVGVEPALVRRVAGLVSAEHAVDTAVLESSLRILIAVSAQPWDVSVAEHLGVVDLVPLLWDTDRPSVQVLCCA